MATPYHLPKKRGALKGTRISFYEGHVSHKINKLSLAKIKWETSRPDLHKEKPLIESSLAAFCNIQFIPLEQSTNR